MAQRETIKRAIFMFRTICEFPVIETKRDEAGEVIRPGTLDTWEFALGDLSDDQVMAAVQHLLANWTDDFKRRPMPGDIRKALETSGSKSHGEAWSEIQSKGHLFVHGGYFSQSQGRCVAPQWSCPEIADAVSQMGGIEVCLSTLPSQLPTVRAQFRDIWADVQQRQRSVQSKVLPQPPQAQQLPPATLSIAGSSESVIDFAAEVRALKFQAQQQAQIDAIHTRLQEIEGRKAAEKRARVQATADGQQSLIRYLSQLDGVPLTKFDLPEVAE